MQIHRLLELIYILLHRKSISARELAEQLDVSRRTIYRYIDILGMAGIPIYTSRGKGGGISLLPDTVLNKGVLTDAEQNEILTALQGFASLQISDAHQVLNKLSNIFNKSANNWLEIDFSDWGGANDYFNDFKKAILERLIVSFDYYNAKGEKTFKRVEPVQLWFKSKNWYVRGFCVVKQEMRVYKLARVKNLVVTSEHFAQREQVVTDEADVASEGDKWTAIRLHVDKKMRYRIYDDFEESHIEEMADGSAVVTVTLPEDNWLYGFILSFGEYAQVLEPAHLRTIIRDKAAKISEKYL